MLELVFPRCFAANVCREFRHLCISEQREQWQGLEFEESAGYTYFYGSDTKVRAILLSPISLCRVCLLFSCNSSQQHNKDVLKCFSVYSLIVFEELFVRCVAFRFYGLIALIINILIRIALVFLYLDLNSKIRGGCHFFPFCCCLCYMSPQTVVRVFCIKKVARLYTVWYCSGKTQLKAKPPLPGAFTFIIAKNTLYSFKILNKKTPNDYSK